MSSHDARHEDERPDDGYGTTTTRTDSPDTIADGGPVLLPVDPGPESTDGHRDTVPDGDPVIVVDGDPGDHRPGDPDLASDRTDLASDRTDLASDRTDLASDRTDLASDQTDLSSDRTDFSSDRDLSSDGVDRTVGPDTESGALKDPVPDGAFGSGTPVAVSTPTPTPTSDPSTSTAAEAVSANDWRDLQGRFVDDPEGAVKEAGAKVEKAFSDLRARSESGSTEDLRTAFRRYRDLHAGLS